MKSFKFLNVGSNITPNNNSYLFLFKIKALNNAVGDLDDEFNKFGPIARDLDTLNKQMNEVHGFISKVASKRKDVEDAARTADEIISQGFAPNPRELKDTVSSLQKGKLRYPKLTKNYFFAIIFCTNFHFWHFSNVPKMIFGSYRNVKKGVLAILNLSKALNLSFFLK